MLPLMNMCFINFFTARDYRLSFKLRIETCVVYVCITGARTPLGFTTMDIFAIRIEGILMGIGNGSVDEEVNPSYPLS